MRDAAAVDDMSCFWLCVNVFVCDCVTASLIYTHRYPLRQATNYIVPSSSGSYGRFAPASSGAFRVLDATRLIGQELPDGYNVLADPVGPAPVEWRHWRLAVLATALLLLLAVRVIAL